MFGTHQTGTIEMHQQVLSSMNLLIYNYVVYPARHSNQSKANPQQHDALGVVHCPICPLRFIVLGNAKNVDEA